MDLPIFGISGLRGVVGEDLFPETAAAVAAGFGTFAGPGPVAVGRDSRVSGEMMAAAAAAGLASAGCEVRDLGICPTPTVLHHVRKHGLAGGIVITASHNPDRWNGMKFAGQGGRFLFGGEVERFRAQLDSGRPRRARWNGPGAVLRDDSAIGEHVAAVVASGLCPPAGRPRRIGIDAVNGAASVAARRLVEELGHSAECVYCDPSPETMKAGFPRRPEPVPEHLGALSAMVRERKLDAGFAFDPDGDRFSCVDETGTPLGEEATICLACLAVIKAGGKSQIAGRQSQIPAVVVNLSTTRAVEDVCRELGAEVVRTPVGEVAVLERMLATGAELGGEGNGGVILPGVNATRDGLVAAAAVLGLLAPEAARLSDIRRRLPRYEMAKTTVALGREEFARRAGRLLAAFAGARVDRQDGVKVDGDDFWVHVRPSNTEPLVRVIAEGRTRARVDEVVERVRDSLGPATEKRD